MSDDDQTAKNDGGNSWSRGGPTAAKSTVFEAEAARRSDGEEYVWKPGQRERLLDLFCAVRDAGLRWREYGLVNQARRLMLDALDGVEDRHLSALELIYDKLVRMAGGEVKLVRGRMGAPKGPPKPAPRRRAKEWVQINQALVQEMAWEIEKAGCSPEIAAKAVIKEAERRARNDDFFAPLLKVYAQANERRLLRAYDARLTAQRQVAAALLGHETQD
jgi:hypothetical protein